MVGRRAVVDLEPPTGRIQRVLFTDAQINELAPDPASAAAGKKLAKPSQWTDLGKSDQAMWGVCHGSALYQVKIDGRAFGYHCNCPSRKFPCKHVLGLLWLNAGNSVPMGDAPPWAVEWLAKRQAREEKKSAQEPAKASEPANVAAITKRAEQRADRVREGLDRLDLWMSDLVRNGLAGLESHPPDFWSDQAKRLVDAQAPGLAGRIEQLNMIPASGSNWHVRLLAELGRIKLMTHAYRRIERLTPELASELRQLIGWNISSAELERDGECVADNWQVIGQWIDESLRIRAQRTWVIGQSTKRHALILQFAPGNQPFSEPMVPGMEWRGPLLFYPGASRQRAKVGMREQQNSPSTAPFDSVPSFTQFFSRVADAVSKQPWTMATAGVISGVRMIPGSPWLMVDHEQRMVPIHGPNHWRWLSICGGHDVDMAGEWNGQVFRPLGMWHQGVYWPA